MKNRISNITFPTDSQEINTRNKDLGHTEYWQYYYYKTFGKFCSLYRLLSQEKDISDEILAHELGNCMNINENYDCRITVDKKWRYKNQGFSAKTYTGLIHLIADKIKTGQLTHAYGYYILCRIADSSDVRWHTQKKIIELLNP